MVDKQEKARKMGLANKGRSSPFKGIPRTDDVKLKISESHKNPYPKIPVLCGCGCNEVVWGESQFRKGHWGRGRTQSEENRRKNSEGHKGQLPWNTGKKLSDEHRQKIKENHADLRGENSPLYGKEFSEIHKQKLSDARKRGFLDGTITLWNKGMSGLYHWSEGSRQKLSAAVSGENNPFYGRHHTNETIQKLKEINIGKKYSPEINKKKARPGILNGMFGISLVLSEERKRELSKINSGKNNKMYGRAPSPKAGRGKGGYYKTPLQGEKWLRSTWEIKYAEYLDAHNIMWLYELETFELSDGTTYTPDFYLPKYERFIEIKGWMRDEYLTKITLFKNEYPWDLDILNKACLKEIGLKL